MVITEDLINQFIKAWQSKEVAANTVKSYAGDLKALCIYMDGKEVTRDKMLEYKTYLAGKYKTETANHRLRTANLFYKFSHFDGMEVKPVPVKRNLTPDNLMNISDLDRVLRYADKRNRQQTYAIIETLVGTGIRFSELKYITVEAVKAGKATVENKGAIRDVPLAAVKKILLTYCQDHSIKTGIIFRTRNGTPISNSQLSRDLKSIAGHARVNKKKIHPHAFRHLFAINFLQSGGVLTALKDILGHKSLDTTSIYTRTTAKQLGQEMAATSILKHIKQKGRGQHGHKGDRL